MQMGENLHELRAVGPLQDNPAQMEQCLLSGEVTLSACRSFGTAE
jgi:hypothetical protein